jgi:hypothetical protein
LKVEPLKRKEKKNWETREGLMFRAKKKKEKASHRKPFGFHMCY